MRLRFGARLMLARHMLCAADVDLRQSGLREGRIGEERDLQRGGADGACAKDSQG